MWRGPNSKLWGRHGGHQTTPTKGRAHWVKENKPCRPKRRAALTEPATASTHAADRDVAVGLRPRGLPHEAQRGPSRSRSRLDDQRCAGHPITRRRNALSPVPGPLPPKADELNWRQGPARHGVGRRVSCVPRAGPPTKIAPIKLEPLWYAVRSAVTVAKTFVGIRRAYRI